MTNSNGMRRRGLRKSYADTLTKYREKNDPRNEPHLHKTVDQDVRLSIYRRVDLDEELAALSVEQ